MNHNIFKRLIIMGLLFITFPALARQSLAPQTLYLNLHWESGKITINQLYIKELKFFPPRQGDLSTKSDEFSFEIYSMEGKLLYKESIPDPRRIYYDELYEENNKTHLRGGSVFLQVTDFFIKIPYWGNPFKLRFFQNISGSKVTRSLISTLIIEKSH